MSASAAELRRAEAAAGRAAGADSTWLLDEVLFQVEPGGATTTRYRSIIAVHSEAGVREWATRSGVWSPWFEDTPSLEARVLDREGAFHRLEPGRIQVRQASTAPRDGDRRHLRADLPAMAPGSIAEIVLTIRQRAPLFAAGSVHGHAIGKPGHHVARTRVIIDAPSGMRLALDEDLKRMVARRTETAAGRTRRIYEAGSLAPMPEEYEVPAEFAVRPSVWFSTGRSWTRVAADYDALVRRQIAAGPLPEEAKVARAATRRATVERAVAFMQRTLYSTGLELADKELAPASPAEVWQRRFGDSKDLAAFLVALLAGARIEAHVALVDAGPDRELSAALPGLGEVDHALVYVPGEKLWINPSDDLARPGQLAFRLQGRLALVAAPSTRAPVRIPASPATSNFIVEERAIRLSHGGPGEVTEVVKFGGERELAIRVWARGAGKEGVKKLLERRVKDAYAARHIANHRVTESDDLSTPFTSSVTVEGAGRAYTLPEDARVRIDVRPLFQVLPRDVQEPRPAGARPPRHPGLLEPHVVEHRYTIRVPDGFEVSALPSRERRFGPASFSQRFETRGREIRGNLRFTLSRARVTPAELLLIEKGVQSLIADPFQLIRLDHDVERKLDAGDLTGALSLARRLVDAAPGEIGHLTRFAYALNAAGLNLEAVEVATQAVKRAPNAYWTHSTLAWIHRHDPVGRREVAGFDRRAAIAAMEKVLELDPDDGGYLERLGRLHGLGDDASHLGGDLARAAQFLERAREHGRKVDEALLPVLLLLGRSARLEELAGTIERAELSGAFRLAAAREDEGFQAALDMIPPPVRDQAVSLAAKAALEVSDHDHLRRIVRLAGASLLLDQAKRDMIARLSRVPVDPVTDHDMASRWTASMLRGEGKRWLSSDARASAAAASLARGPAWNPFSPPLPGVTMREQLLADVIRASTSLRPIGRAASVEAFDAATIGKTETGRFYIVREGKQRRPRLLGVGSIPQLLAPAVLRAAAAGQLDDARRILDWAVADLPEAKSRDLAGVQLHRFWTRGQRGDDAHIRLAAASLLVEADPARSLTILAADCPRAAGLAAACRFARAAALARQDRHREAEEVVKGLAVDPDPAFVAGKANGLREKKAWAELERLAAGKLPEAARMGVQITLAWSWIARGQPARARAIADSMRASTAGQALGWRNNTAWLYLFTGGDIAPVVADLERALADARPGAAALHTLATCYARIGRHRDALATIQRAANVRGRADPIDQIVVGRIAAAAGLHAVARRTYERVIAGDSDSGSLSSTAALARRWMAELPK